MNDQSQNAELSAPTNFDEIIQPADLAAERPDLFNKGQLQWWIKSRATNGLKEAGAVIRNGKRFVLHRARFIDWYMSRTV